MTLSGPVTTHGAFVNDFVWSLNDFRMPPLSHQVANEGPQRSRGRKDEGPRSLAALRGDIRLERETGLEPLRVSMAL